MWATLAVSIIAILISIRLGGSLDVIAVKRGSSKGQDVALIHSE